MSQTRPFLTIYTRALDSLMTSKKASQGKKIRHTPVSVSVSKQVVLSCKNFPFFLGLYRISDEFTAHLLDLERQISKS